VKSIDDANATTQTGSNIFLILLSVE